MAGLGMFFGLILMASGGMMCLQSLSGKSLSKTDTLNDLLLELAARLFFLGFGAAITLLGYVMLPI